MTDGYFLPYTLVRDFKITIAPYTYIPIPKSLRVVEKYAVESYNIKRKVIWCRETHKFHIYTRTFSNVPFKVQIDLADCMTKYQRKLRVILLALGDLVYQA